MKRGDNRKVWMVEMPSHQYKEDVKALAKEAGLKVVDAKFSDNYSKDDIATDTPKLTKKGKPGRKPKAQAKTDDKAEDKGE